MLFPLRMILAQPPPCHRSNSWLPTTIPLCDLCGLCAMLPVAHDSRPAATLSPIEFVNSYRFQPPEHRLLGFNGQKDDEADANRQQPVTQRDRR
jgi:hypothetical protein